MVSLSGEQLEVIRSVKQHMERASDTVASWEKDYVHLMSEQEQFSLGDACCVLSAGADELSAVLQVLEKES